IKTALAVLGTHALKPAAVEYTYEGEHNVYFVGVNQDSICGARINYQAQKASEGMIDALACKDSKEKARVKALKASARSALVALFSPEPKTLVLGTNPGETADIQEIRIMDGTAEEVENRFLGHVRRQPDGTVVTTEPAIPPDPAFQPLFFLDQKEIAYFLSRMAPDWTEKDTE